MAPWNVSGDDHVMCDSRLCGMLSDNGEEDKPT